MKWTAVALIAIGVCLIVYAMKSDHVSSIDDGSFLLQIGALLVGGIAILAGFVIFVVLAFQALS